MHVWIISNEPKQLFFIPPYNLYKISNKCSDKILVNIAMFIDEKNS